jgi:excisionase family DNA binding protein
MLMKKTRAKKKPVNLRTLNVFTTGQVAQICRCCIGTIIENIKEGLLKGYRLPGSTHRRVTRDELARYMGAYGLPLEWLPKP